MPLKYKYPTKQEIPAEQQALYVEREGAFYLDAEGVVDQSKLDELRTADKARLEEFRANNIALTNQLKRFEGIDPEAIRSLQTATMEKQKAMEEEQRLKEGKFQEVLESRLKTAEADWAKKLDTIVADRDGLNDRLTAIQIDQAVMAEATKRGLRATALPDLTSRARQTFKLVNGVPQAFDGETVLVGKDGVSPMTLAEWVDALVSNAPHLFEANAGGGAVGSGPGGAGNRSVTNPFRKDTWNLTEQMKIQKSDPALAARLKAAA